MRDRLRPDYAPDGRRAPGRRSRSPAASRRTRSPGSWGSTPGSARPRSRTSGSGRCSTRGQTGLLGRARPADPDGYRLRRPARGGRGRPGRRRDRLARRHRDPDGRDSAARRSARSAPPRTRSATSGRRCSSRWPSDAGRPGRRSGCSSRTTCSRSSSHAAPRSSRPEASLRPRGRHDRVLRAPSCRPGRRWR